MSDLPNLGPFVSAARCGCFATAAEQLGVTPPAVSKSIARLEQRLGVRLFNRTTRKLSLTAEGQAFLQRVSPMMDGLQHALDELRESGTVPRGLLRVACGATLGRHCLLPKLEGFFQRYPEVDLSLDLNDQPRDLLEHGVDVSIRHGLGSQTTHVMRRLPFQYRVVLVASPTYLQRRGVPTSIDDLMRHGSIGLSEPGRSFGAWHLVRSAPESGLDVRVPLMPGKVRFATGTSFDLCLSAAVHHLGIAAIGVPMALPYLQSGLLKVVLPQYEVRSSSTEDNQVFVQYAHREHLAPKVRVFVDFVVECFGQQDDGLDAVERFAA